MDLKSFRLLNKGITDMKLNYLKWGKLIVGAVLACLIADWIGLQYYAAAGIITLLTIQDTKKETIRIALKRLLIFVIMTGLSAVIFPLVGYDIVGFGIILIPYLFICLALKMPEAIAPIAVLCTHYMSSKSCSLSLIENEFLILLIGAGIGVALNLFMPNNKKKILEFQKETDDKIIGILHRMSLNIIKEDRTDYTGSCFEDLDAVLIALEREARFYMDNHVTRSDDYFLRYMNMRLRQCARLKEMYADIRNMDVIVTQAEPISEFLEKIASEFSEENDVEELLRETETLIENYRKNMLPTTREEFEARAILFDFLSNTKAFLQIKRDFCMQRRID